MHDGQLQLEDLSRKALGSRVLFHIPAEVGYRYDDHNSLSAYFEHMSNAETVSLNESIYRLGTCYGLPFLDCKEGLRRASCARSRTCEKRRQYPKNQDFPA